MDVSEVISVKIGNRDFGRYMSTKDAAAYCTKTPEAIRSMCRRAGIPIIKIGKTVMLDRLELDKFMKSRTVKA